MAAKANVWNIPHAATLNSIKPGITAARKTVLIALFQRGVNGLAAAGWLTSGQASELTALPPGLPPA